MSNHTIKLDLCFEMQVTEKEMMVFLEHPSLLEAALLQQIQEGKLSTTEYTTQLCLNGNRRFLRGTLPASTLRLPQSEGKACEPLESDVTDTPAVLQMCTLQDLPCTYFDLSKVSIYLPNKEKYLIASLSKSNIGWFVGVKPLAELAWGLTEYELERVNTWLLENGYQLTTKEAEPRDGFKLVVTEEQLKQVKDFELLMADYPVCVLTGLNPSTGKAETIATHLYFYEAFQGALERAGHWETLQVTVPFLPKTSLLTISNNLLKVSSLKDENLTLLKNTFTGSGDQFLHPELKAVYQILNTLHPDASYTLALRSSKDGQVANLQLIEDCVLSEALRLSYIYHLDFPYAVIEGEPGRFIIHTQSPDRPVEQTWHSREILDLKPLEERNQGDIQLIKSQRLTKEMLLNSFYQFSDFDQKQLIKDGNLSILQEAAYYLKQHGDRAIEILLNTYKEKALTQSQYDSHLRWVLLTLQDAILGSVETLR